jgi:putative FmdB family regulatory protein
MPTYEYRCRSCGHELEHFQSMTTDPLTDCPECEKPDLERLIGAGAGLIFKGSGYYQTDYRSDAYKADAKKDKEAGKKKESDSKTSAKSSEKQTAPKDSNTSGSSSSPDSSGS